VLRREVARVLSAGHADTASAKGSLASLLDQITSRDGPSERVNAPSGELNLDSLARVELQAGIEEQFGVTVDDTTMQSVRTIDDLKAVLNRPAQASSETPVAIPAASERKHIYPVWPWNVFVRACRSVFLDTVMRAFVWVLANPRIHRTSTQLPNRPVLIYANHVTAVDVALILYALPGRIRRQCC
jgi:long-chain acyl-CoA synthetase